MDPVTISVVAAVAATATAVANGAASAAGKDAYERLKRVIAARFASAQPALAAVEAGPTLAPNREALATQLEATGAFRDAEVREVAQRLLAALIARRDDPAVAPLLDFEELEAAGNFEMTDITAVGTVLKARKKATFKKDVKLSGIRQIPGGREKH